MRRIILFLVLSVAGVNLYALALDGNKKPPDRSTIQTEQKRVPASRDRKQAPVKNYTPTEKIKADSAVSFPVDI